MEIYLLRHGIAEEARAGGRDGDRALTSEGRKKLGDVLRLAQAAGVAPSLILASPYRRAVETARVAAEILGSKADLLQSKALLPMAAPEEAWEEIRTHKGEEQVLLAGHEPQFSQLAAFLLGASQVRIDFKKGALVRIDVDRFGALPSGELKWMLVAKLATAVP